ncbi:MAG: hypothetical protein OXE87_15040 [Chloroflexi bacterium]|nr:hypothetical protein [Chloroflexota bacterium]
MATHLEADGGRGGSQGFLNIAVRQVGGGSANGTEHMVVVSLVAKLVPKFAVLQEDPANLVGFDEQAESAKHGGPTHARESGAEVLGGKRAVMGSNSTDHEAAGFGIAISHGYQALDDVIDDGGGAGTRVMVSRVFLGCGDHVDMESRLYPYRDGIVKRWAGCCGVYFRGSVDQLVRPKAGDPWVDPRTVRHAMSVAIELVRVRSPGFRDCLGTEQICRAEGF